MNLEHQFIIASNNKLLIEYPFCIGCKMILKEKEKKKEQNGLYLFYPKKEKKKSGNVHLLGGLSK